MEAELKAKWVDALRSGKFKQGAGRFERGDKFCCLGVLCAVAGKPGFLEKNKDNYAFIDPIVGNQKDHLIEMNDGGRPFPEIADYIEQNL